MTGQDRPALFITPATPGNGDMGNTALLKLHGQNPVLKDTKESEFPPAKHRLDFYPPHKHGDGNWQVRELDPVQPCTIPLVSKALHQGQNPGIIFNLAVSFYALHSGNPYASA